MPRYHGSGWDSPKLLALLRLSPDLSGCVRTAAGTHPASLMKNAPARPPRGGKRYSSPWASLSCTRSCRACSSDSRLAKPRSILATLPVCLSQTIHWPRSAPCLTRKRDSVIFPSPSARSRPAGGTLRSGVVLSAYQARTRPKYRRPTSGPRPAPRIAYCSSPQCAAGIRPFPARLGG
jgi:hypothetical protein